jgi:hypothetical protein
MHMSMPCEGKADCCKVSPQIPPATVTRLFPGFASNNVTEDFLSAASGSASREAAIAPVVPSQSSPPGTSSSESRASFFAVVFRCAPWCASDPFLLPFNAEFEE